MSDKSKSSFEKIVLAGIGALATTAERSKEMLDELVKKGELTVEQGKTLNEELRHTVRSAFSEAGEPIQEFAVPEIVETLEKLTPEELAQIRSKLQELEKTDESRDEAADN